MHESAKLLLGTVGLSFLATLGACGARYEIGEISQGGAGAGGAFGRSAGGSGTPSSVDDPTAQTDDPDGIAGALPSTDDVPRGSTGGRGPGSSSSQGTGGIAPGSNSSQGTGGVAPVPVASSGGAPSGGVTTGGRAGAAASGPGGAPNTTQPNVDPTTCAEFPVDTSMLHYGTLAAPDVVIARFSQLLNAGVPFSVPAPDVVTPEWAAQAVTDDFEYARQNGAEKTGLGRFLMSWFSVGQLGKSAILGTIQAFVDDANFTSLIAPPGGGGLLVDPGLARSNTTIDTRGVALLSSMFCTSVGPQPFGTNPSGVSGSALFSRRQSLEIATAGASCRGCHALLDPLGASEEILDPTTGARRTTDEFGLPIDASGSFSTGQFPYSEEYSFTSIDDLAPQLASSCEVLRCFVQSYVNDGTTALGLPSLPADEFEFVVQTFTTSGYSLRAVVRGFAQTPTFLQ
jgi:hypothetical protein